MALSFNFPSKVHGCHSVWGFFFRWFFDIYIKPFHIWSVSILWFTDCLTHPWWGAGFLEYLVKPIWWWWYIMTGQRLVRTLIEFMLLRRNEWWGNKSVSSQMKPLQTWFSVSRLWLFTPTCLFLCTFTIIIALSEYYYRCFSLYLGLMCLLFTSSVDQNLAFNLQITDVVYKPDKLQLTVKSWQLIDRYLIVN